MSLLRLPALLRFRGLVGTGGIGHGSFMLLEGNQTLGREESRSARLLDRRDYCKLHIICHYLKVLLGSDFRVYPVGRVGDDDAGSRLFAEMKAVGMDLDLVRAVPGARTLYSFCLVYPDGSGGNLTSVDSASSRVDPAAVREATPVLRALGRGGVALAVPEVPLPTRRAILESATEHGLFRAASFTTEEMEEVRETGLLSMVDLCAMNLEEAAAAARTDSRSAPAAAAEKAISVICRDFPSLMLSVTAGAAGSWSRDRSGIVFDPAIPVQVEGTSGAGDAHFSGLLAGLAAGLDLAEAQQLATVVAAASVTSVHTIHPFLTADLLRSMLRLRALTAPHAAALLDSSNDQS